MRRVCIESVNASLTLSLAATSVRQGLGFWQGRDGHVLTLTPATEGVALKSSRLTLPTVIQP